MHHTYTHTHTHTQREKRSVAERDDNFHLREKNYVSLLFFFTILSTGHNLLNLSQLLKNPF